MAEEKVETVGGVFLSKESFELLMRFAACSATVAVFGHDQPGVLDTYHEGLDDIAKHISNLEEDIVLLKKLAGL